MSYVGLGVRGPVAGVKDTTGLNSGNWTVTIDQSILTTNIPYFECYRIVVNGAANSRFRIFIDQKQWEVAMPGLVNSWEGIQPMLLVPTSTLYFLWDDPATDNTPPSVYMWLRYDPSIPANAATAGS